MIAAADIGLIDRPARIETRDLPARTRPRILSVSLTYPSADWPARGMFIRRRLEALARFADISVLAPRPWFPLRPVASPLPLAGELLATCRPRMFYLPGVLKPTDPWFYARLLTREIRRMPPSRRPQLIDAHYEWPDGVAAVRAGRALGLPVVVTLRGKLASLGRHPMRRAQVVDMLRRADALIAVSRDLADKARALAGDALDVRVIPNGVDAAVFFPTDREAARTALGLSRQARCLVSVGYVQELKGFHRVVEVLPEVRRRAGDVRLMLIGREVGEDDYVRRLDATIARLELKPYVTRVADGTPQDTARWLNAADLFVLATRSEGWCNAIHEALACGTPVVASDVGGNPELVRRPDDGLLVPFGDAATLTRAIVEGLSRSWPRESIAARAATRTWDVVAREVWAVVRDVLGLRGEGLKPA